MALSSLVAKESLMRLTCFDILNRVIVIRDEHVIDELQRTNVAVDANWRLMPQKKGLMRTICKSQMSSFLDLDT